MIMESLQNDSLTISNKGNIYEIAREINNKLLEANAVSAIVYVRKPGTNFTNI